MSKRLAVTYSIIPDTPLRPFQELTELEASVTPINPVSAIFVDADSLSEAREIVKKYVNLKYGYKKDKICILSVVEI